MTEDTRFQSKHFTLEPLTEGIYACVEKPGGGAYSNAGIIDLGDRTLVLDAFDTRAAANDLCRAAETLFNRPVETLVLTHPHSDHWLGAAAFDDATAFITGREVWRVVLEWAAYIKKDRQDPAEWKAYIREMEEQLDGEEDERLRVSLEKSIRRTRYALAEMPGLKLRYPDLTFEGSMTFHGSSRSAELRSCGRGHSEQDLVLLLPQDQIAFIGDIGFFDTQPFLGYCDLELYRAQVDYFLESDYKIFVPGHGPVGYGVAYLEQQREYFDVLEARVGEVFRGGGSFEEALQVSLPAPFDTWLVGGMGRLEANVRYLFERLGGEVPGEG